MSHLITLFGMLHLHFLFWRVEMLGKTQVIRLMLSNPKNGRRVDPLRHLINCDADEDHVVGMEYVFVGIGGVPMDTPKSLKKVKSGERNYIFK